MTEKYPTVEKQEYVHQGYFDLRIDTLKKDNGASAHYTILCTKVDAVCILATDAHQNFILNREYRHPIGKYILTCPGGRLEHGEDPLEAARRELLEETGYHAETLHLLGHYYPLPSICDQKLSLFFAPNAKPQGKQKLDTFEFIETTLISKKELLEKIKKGADIDGVLSACLFYKAILWKD